MTTTCSACRHWRRLDEYHGECHGSIPRPEMSYRMEGRDVCWPRTRPDETGCVGWQPLPLVQVNADLAAVSAELGLPANTTLPDVLDAVQKQRVANGHLSDMVQRQTQPRQILLDLDGVLCWFVRGALRAHGFPDDHPLTPGEWHFYRDDMGMDETAFWAKCDGASFWEELEPLPDFLDILTLCEGYAGRENVCLLTAPSADPCCPEGKLRWIARHLPLYSRRYLMGPAKEFAAHPGRVLVDDSDANVQAYRQAGGTAFLLPRPQNSRHAEAGQAVPLLEAFLTQCFGRAIRAWPQAEVKPGEVLVSEED